jgi:hypothetical protein
MGGMGKDSEASWECGTVRIGIANIFPEAISEHYLKIKVMTKVFDAPYRLSGGHLAVQLV